MSGEWIPQKTDHREAFADAALEREGEERPWALLVDDGELEDVHQALQELGTPTLRLLSGEHESGWRQPQRLLVVSDRRSLTLGRPVAQEENHFFTIAVLEKPSKTLSTRIQRMGFDYLVRRPIDSDALHMLLRDALFRGRERRAERRIPVGWELTFRARWRTRRAVLAELSKRGCSLQTHGILDPGRRIFLRLPGELAGGEPLTLRGQVLRGEVRQSRDGSAIHSVLFDRQVYRSSRLADALAVLRRGSLPLPR